jgi:hypothetical protein
MKDKLPPLIVWSFYTDGTIKKSWTPPGEPSEIRKDPVEEPPPEIASRKLTL